MISASLVRRSRALALHCSFGRHSAFNTLKKFTPPLTHTLTRSFSTSNLNQDIERDVFIFGEPTPTPTGTTSEGVSSAVTYKTFVDMGIAPQLAIALKKTEKTIPTLIQKTSYETIFSKKDVIICAETGSGKTLAYLLPILHQYYTSNIDRAQVEGGFKYPTTVIMVPNKELMAQVYNMSLEILQHANTVRTTITGESCVQVTCGCMERVDGHWPYRGVPDEPLSHAPDILICTPAFLGSFIHGPKILEENFFYSIKRCVLDEADMLLEGSYKQDMEKIFDVFKVLRRRLMKKFDMKPHERVVQFVLSAATISTHGKLSVDQYLRKRFPRAERFTSESFHMHHPRIEQDFLHVNLLDDNSAKEGTPDTYEDSEGNIVEYKLPVMSPTRVDLVFRAIIGALPPREEQDEEQGVVGTWDKDQWREKFNIENIPPTMIFANTAGKARELAAALAQHEEGLLSGAVGEFHKLVPTYEKQDALEKFRAYADSGVKVLVCTDAAARGLDLPAVEHVIQAEFALNVVQHVHRNGRASRAGKLGRATMIFDDSSADLVQSVLSSGDDKRGIEQSFSRRRGFRRNLNRKARTRSPDL